MNINSPYVLRHARSGISCHLLLRYCTSESRIKGHVLRSSMTAGHHDLVRRHHHSSKYVPQDQKPSAIPCTNQRLPIDAYTARKITVPSDGRWLHHDKLQREARSLSFDFHALCGRVVSACPGATSISHFTNFEGGYNIVYIFTCDNATRAVAKLPMSVAGPVNLVINSEVATIEYSKSPL